MLILLDHLLLLFLKHLLSHFDTTKKKLKMDNKLARCYLLNNMFNPLFNPFFNFKYAKLIWTKLNAKYGLDDDEKKKICRRQVATIPDYR